MSEDVSIERLPVAQAAEVLGVTRDAIHKRIHRGTIDYEKGEDGRYYVYVDTSTEAIDRSADTSKDESKVEALERLIRNQEDRVSFLERDLERRGDETERLHQIVAGLTRATAELSARLPELEAPSEARGAPQRAARGTERGKPHPATDERSERTTRPPRTTSALTSRLGMSAWALGIGAVATLLTGIALVWIPSLFPWISYPPSYRAGTMVGTLLLSPLLSGLWAGFTKRPSLPWITAPHRWLRRGGRSVLEIATFAIGTPALVGWAVAVTLGYAVGVFFLATDALLLTSIVLLATAALLLTSIVLLAFMSGAFLGHALRRFGILGSPKTPSQVEEDGEEEVWSPRQEARWGLLGSIITASIPAITSLVVALLTRGN